MRRVLNCLGLVLFVATDVCAGEVTVAPACPSPSAVVSLLVSQDRVPPTFLPADTLILKNGTTFRLLLDASQVAIPGRPSSVKRVAIGQLAVGTYSVDVYYRYQLGPADYLPEQFFGSLTFEVKTSSESTPCAAGVLAITSGGFQRAPAGEAFPQPIVVEARDGQLRPVPNAQVRLERLMRPEDAALTEAQQPGATRPMLIASTDAQGLARFSLTANMATGTYQYRAALANAAYGPEAFAVLDNRSQPPQSTFAVLPVVEYYNAARDHYFITQRADEQRELDAGLAQGWERTGAIFLGMPPGASVANAQPVCRFYGLPQAGLDSHFFSASPVECDAVLQKFAASWVLEASDAFREFLPDNSDGDCPIGTAPLFRVYSNRADANHRYTLSSWVQASMVARGWIPEGYGPSAVAMCVPT